MEGPPEGSDEPLARHPAGRKRENNPLRLAGLSLALLAQGSMQAIPNVVGKLIQLAIAIELDGLARGVKKNLAMVAAL